VVAGGSIVVGKVNAKVDENSTLKSAKDTTSENLTKASAYFSSTFGSYFGGWGSKPKPEELAGSLDENEESRDVKGAGSLDENEETKNVVGNEVENAEKKEEDSSSSEEESPKDEGQVATDEQQPQE